MTAYVFFLICLKVLFWLIVMCLFLLSKVMWWLSYAFLTVPGHAVLDCHVFSTAQGHVVIGYHVYFLLSKVMWLLTVRCVFYCPRSCGAFHLFCDVKVMWWLIARCVFCCPSYVVIDCRVHFLLWLSHVSYFAGPCGEALAVVLNNVYDWTIQLVTADDFDQTSFCRWGQYCCAIS